jgi:hypothetical protein
LRRLERHGGGLVYIPQQGGGVARFRQRELLDAYLVAVDHAVGLDVPDHPLCAAARNSSSTWWRQSAYATEPDPREIEDLSE